jgi:hypothetical protein
MQCAQAAKLQKLEHGDISGVLKTALENAVDIQAPVFFANSGGPQSTLSSQSAHSHFNRLQLLQSMGYTAAYSELCFPVLVRPSYLNAHGIALRVCFKSSVVQGCKNVHALRQMGMQDVPGIGMFCRHHIY